MFIIHWIHLCILAYSAMRITDYGQDIVYPADLSRGAQITLPSSLLNESRATGE